MEEQKLVLQDGTYKYDNRTNQVSVSEDELKKAGYVKLADDEQIVKKVELSEEEAEFMEDNKGLAFYDPQNIDFEFKANDYAEHLKDIPKIYKRLVKAYFCGYKVRETKYYIKFNFSNNGFGYLNIRKDNGHWSVRGPVETSDIQTMFTQKEIKALQENKQAKGLDLNELKVNISDIDITAKW